MLDGMFNTKFKGNFNGIQDTGVCLILAVELTQDLTIKKHRAKQNNKLKKKTNKNNKNSSTVIESGEEFIVKNVGCVLLPATTSLKVPFGKKICCVLLPASL